jgi:hypothetical protein
VEQEFQGLSPIQTIMKLAEERLIRGMGLGPNMEHGLRLSYGPLCYDHDHITEGIERISQYLGKKR